MVLSNSSLGFIGEQGRGSAAQYHRGRDNSWLVKNVNPTVTQMHTPCNAKIEKMIYQVFFQIYFFNHTHTQKQKNNWKEKTSKVFCTIFPQLMKKYILNFSVCSKLSDNHFMQHVANVIITIYEKDRVSTSLTHLEKCTYFFPILHCKNISNWVRLEEDIQVLQKIPNTI